MPRRNKYEVPIKFTTDVSSLKEATSKLGGELKDIGDATTKSAAEALSAKIQSQLNEAKALQNDLSKVLTDLKSRKGDAQQKFNVSRGDTFAKNVTSEIRSISNKLRSEKLKNEEKTVLNKVLESLQALNGEINRVKKEQKVTRAQAAKIVVKDAVNARNIPDRDRRDLYENVISKAIKTQVPDKTGLFKKAKVVSDLADEQREYNSSLDQTNRLQATLISNLDKIAQKLENISRAQGKVSSIERKFTGVMDTLGADSHSSKLRSLSKRAANKKLEESPDAYTSEFDKIINARKAQVAEAENLLRTEAESLTDAQKRRLQNKISTIRARDLNQDKIAAQREELDYKLKASTDTFNRERTEHQMRSRSQIRSLATAMSERRQVVHANALDTDSIDKIKRERDAVKDLIEEYKRLEKHYMDKGQSQQAQAYNAEITALQSALNSANENIAASEAKLKDRLNPVSRTSRRVGVVDASGSKAREAINKATYTDPATIKQAESVIEAHKRRLMKMEERISKGRVKSSDKEIDALRSRLERERKELERHYRKIATLKQRHTRYARGIAPTTFFERFQANLGLGGLDAQGNFRGVFNGGLTTHRSELGGIGGIGRSGGGVKGLFGYGGSARRMGHYVSRGAQMLGLPLYGFGVGAVVTGFARKTIGAFSEAEGMKNTLAGMINTYAEFVDLQGQSLDKATQFNMAINKSEKVYKDIRKAAVESILTTQEMFDFFLSGGPQLMSKGGLNMNQTLSVVDRIASLGKAMGLANTAVMSDIRDIAQGRVTVRSQVLRTIGFNTQELQAGIRGGPDQLMNIINERLSEFEPMFERIRETTQSKLSRVADAFQQASIAVGEGVAEGLLPALLELKDFVNEWVASGDAKRFGDMLGDALKQMTEVLMVFIEKAEPLFSNFWNIALAGLMSAITIFVGRAMLEASKLNSAAGRLGLGLASLGLSIALFMKNISEAQARKAQKEVVKRQERQDFLNNDGNEYKDYLIEGGDRFAGAAGAQLYRMALVNPNVLNQTEKELLKPYHAASALASIRDSTLRDLEKMGRLYKSIRKYTGKISGRDKTFTLTGYFRGGATDFDDLPTYSKEETIRVARQMGLTVDLGVEDLSTRRSRRPLYRMTPLNTSPIIRAFFSIQSTKADDALKEIIQTVGQTRNDLNNLEVPDLMDGKEIDAVTNEQWAKYITAAADNFLEKNPSGVFVDEALKESANVKDLTERIVDQLLDGKNFGNLAGIDSTFAARLLEEIVQSLTEMYGMNRSAIMDLQVSDFATQRFNEFVSTNTSLMNRLHATDIGRSRLISDDYTAQIGLARGEFVKNLQKVGVEKGDISATDFMIEASKFRSAMEGVNDAYVEQLRALREQIETTREQTSLNKEQNKLLAQQIAQEKEMFALQRDMNTASRTNFAERFGLAFRGYSNSLVNVRAEGRMQRMQTGFSRNAINRSLDSAESVLGYFGNRIDSSIPTMQIDEDSLKTMGFITEGHVASLASTFDTTLGRFDRVADYMADAFGEGAYSFQETMQEMSHVSEELEVLLGKDSDIVTGLFTLGGIMETVVNFFSGRVSSSSLDPAINLTGLGASAGAGSGDWGLGHAGVVADPVGVAATGTGTGILRPFNPFGANAGAVQIVGAARAGGAGSFKGRINNAFNLPGLLSGNIGVSTGQMQGPMLPGTLPVARLSSGNTQYDTWFAQASALTGVPVDLLHAVAKQESSYNPNAVSSAGAQGIMQFMPGTGARYGLATRADRMNPEKSIKAGARHLKDLYDQFENWALVLAAYNAGPNRQSLREGRIPNIPETVNYVKKISSAVPEIVALTSDMMANVSDSSVGEGAGAAYSQIAQQEVLNKLKEEQEALRLRMQMIQQFDNIASDMINVYVEDFNFLAEQRSSVRNLRGVERKAQEYRNIINTELRGKSQVLAELSETISETISDMMIAYAGVESRTGVNPEGKRIGRFKFPTAGGLAKGIGPVLSEIEKLNNKLADLEEYMRKLGIMVENVNAVFSRMFDVMQREHGFRVDRIGQFGFGLQRTNIDIDYRREQDNLQFQMGLARDKVLNEDTIATVSAALMAGNMFPLMATMAELGSAVKPYFDQMFDSEKAKAFSLAIVESAEKLKEASEALSDTVTSQKISRAEDKLGRAFDRIGSGLDPAFSSYADPIMRGFQSRQNNIALNADLNAASRKQRMMQTLNGLLSAGLMTPEQYNAAVANIDRNVQLGRESEILNETNRLARDVAGSRSAIRKATELDRDTGVAANIAGMLFADPLSMFSGKGWLGMLGEGASPYLRSQQNMTSNRVRMLSGMFMGKSPNADQLRALGYTPSLNPGFAYDARGALVSLSSIRGRELSRVGLDFAGQLGGNTLGRLIGGEEGAVSMGTQLGGLAGGMLFQGLGMFGGPVGALAGGLIGGLFGRRSQRDEEAEAHKRRVEELLSSIDKSLRPVGDYYNSLKGEALYGRSSRYLSGRVRSSLNVESVMGSRF